MASLSSGIGLDAALVSIFSNNSLQVVQVKISGEAFVAGNSVACSSFQDAVSKYQSWLSPKECCYVLIKFKPSSLAAQSQGWSLLQFTPDEAAVREKMMYSSSKGVLLKELPCDLQTLFQVFATSAKELSKEGLDDLVASDLAPKPLTDREKEKIQHTMQEASAAMGISARSTNASNLQFDISSEAQTALTSTLKDTRNGGLVALSIQDEKTVLKIQHTKVSNVQQLATILPSQEPLFVFFVIGGAGNGEIVFAYISPPECKIKERMLFAASRQTVIQSVEQILSTSIRKKVEVDSVQELIKEDLGAADAASTQPALGSNGNLGSSSRLKFDKPKRPGK